MNALLVAALVLAAPATKDPPKKAEPPSVVGEWAVEETVRGGKVMPVADSEGFEFAADGTYQIRFQGRALKSGTYQTAPGKDATAIDLKFQTDKIAPGIFKIEKDRLTLCIDDAGGGAVRPAGFESPAGSWVVLMTLKRVEKK
jgi:uncharacterized protein (TIGR03067 family)